MSWLAYGSRKLDPITQTDPATLNSHKPGTSDLPPQSQKVPFCPTSAHLHSSRNKSENQLLVQGLVFLSSLVYC